MTLSTLTPRTSATWARDTGCLYATNAERLEGGSRQPARLALEGEALHVPGEVGVALEAVAARHPDQLETPVLGGIGVGEGLAHFLDPRRRDLQDLGQQVGRDRLLGHHHDGLDGALDLARHQPWYSSMGPTGKRDGILQVLTIDTQPGDPQVPEVAPLDQLDPAPLVQLENRQEPDDHLQALDEAGGEPGERDRPHPRQFIEQFRHRVGHAGADRGDVVQVDTRAGVSAPGR